MKLIRMATALVAAAWLSAPANAGYFGDRVEARRLILDENWAQAVETYQDLLETDPYHGSDWFFLALAHAGLGDCANARPAMERAIALGVDGTEGGMSAARVEAAACAAEMGAVDAALEHLSIAQARYGFSDFGGLEDDPRFSSLIGLPHYADLAGTRDWSKMGRTAGWRADLDRFAGLVERRHPKPFHTVSEREWRAAARALRRRIPTLSDLEIIGGFMRLASMIGDGHTSIYPPFAGGRAFHLTPIWPYAFPDGWRIVSASPDHADLVGARIISIEGVSMDEAIVRIAARLPRDNDRTPLWLGAIGLQFSEIAGVALGGVDPMAMTVEVETVAGEKKTVKLDAGPIDRNPLAPWRPEGWPSAEAADRPLWLSRPNEAFWFADLDELGAVYAQVNQIRDSEEQTLAQFAEELSRHIRETGAKRLILDLRHNNGGNGDLNWALVRSIVRSETIDRNGGLFVIIGRRTFSAAMTLSSMLETHAHAIFVGEPTGSRPNFYGEDTEFVLPYSGLTGSISSRWFQGGMTSNDERPWIAPDLVAELTFDNLRDGRDPALEAIKRFVARGEAETRP